MKWGAFYRQSKKIKYLHNRRKLIGNYTSEQWEKLCSFFNGICPRCGKQTDKFTVDHIIPLSRGGTNTIDNLVPLCLRCNIQKSNIYTTDYRPENVKEWAENERLDNQSR